MEDKFIKTISKKDLDLIKEFDKKILSKLDDSCFNLGLEIVRRILKQIDVKMSVMDYEHKNVSFEFDDITFTEKRSRK